LEWQGPLRGSAAQETSGGDLVWAFDASADVSSSPTVADGTVYVGSNDSTLYAVDAATWSQQGHNPYDELKRVARDNEMISRDQTVPAVETAG
jgi:outer membrane protein assembly factor BamB